MIPQGSPYGPFVTITLAGSWAGDGSLPTMATSVERSSNSSSGPANKKAYSTLKDVIHHTDRGSQYTSIRFRAARRGRHPNRRSQRKPYDTHSADDQRPIQDRADQTWQAPSGGPSRMSSYYRVLGRDWRSTIAASTQYCGDVPPVELEAAHMPPPETSWLRSQDQRVSGEAASKTNYTRCA